MISKQPERFRCLAHEFDVLVQSLRDCPSLEKRKQLLRRMKILIDEIDELIILNFESRKGRKSNHVRAQPTHGQILNAGAKHEGNQIFVDTYSISLIASAAMESSNDSMTC